MSLAPPADAYFPTFDEGFTAWQAHALSQGYALKKSNSTDKRNGQYTRYILRCTVGCNTGIPSDTAVRSSTIRTKCGFEAVAKLYQYAENWSFQVKNPNHSHYPTFSTPIHRRKQMTATITGAIDRGIDNLTSRREIYKTIKAIDPTTTLTFSDIGNYMLRKKREAMGQYTDCAQIIRTLQQDNQWHRVEYRDGRVYRIIWSPDWGQTMWKESHEVVMLDATYKVNAFHKPFFEIVGTTSVNTTFNIAFAILPDELENSQSWVMQQLDELRKSLEIDPPCVAVTDRTDGTRTAVATVWPSTQPQLCLWHVMTDVRDNVRSFWEGPIPKGYRPLGVNELLGQRWQKPANVDDETAEAQEPSPPPPPPPATLNKNALDEPRRRRREALGLPAIDHDINGLLTLWCHLAHCKYEADALRHWEDLRSEFSGQARIITYLANTYWQCRQQWAYCFVRCYRNYGIRATAKVDSAHSELKTYLQSHWTSGFQLYKGTVAISKENQDRFDKRQQYQSDRNVTLTKAPMFSDRVLRLKVSWYALDIAYTQYQAAVAAHREGKELTPCSGNFTRSMGMPCRHTLFRRLYSQVRRGGKRTVYVKSGEQLRLADFDTHWWLQVDLTKLDPLLLVGDFEVDRTARKQRQQPAGSQPPITIPRMFQTPATSFQPSDSQRMMLSSSQQPEMGRASQQHGMMSATTSGGFEGFPPAVP